MYRILMNNHFYGTVIKIVSVGEKEERETMAKRGYLLVYNNKQVRQACLRNAIN